MRISLLSLAFLSTIVLAGCESEAREAAEHADVTPEIEAVNDSFEQAWRQGDAEGLTALYTSDAMLMPPNSPTLTGTEAIRGLWSSFIGSGAGTIELTTGEVVGDEAMAHEIGTWVIRDSTGASVDNGKYIVIWKHTPEGWKFHRDMWSSDNPPMAADTTT